jgi:flagellar hook-basal body complex protein FliE
VIPAISGAIGIGPAHPAGEWSVGSIGSIGAGTGTAGTGAIDAGGGATSGSGSFGGALTNAIDSLDKTQATATQAAQGLATGTLTDPTQAVTAVENASLSMDLAAQIRDKLSTAESTIFQTQV